MRIATYGADGARRPGIVTDDGIVDLGGLFASVGELVAGGSPALAEVQAYGRRTPERTLSEVPLGPPLQPRNIFCVGWNYLKHFREGRHEEDLPDYPNLFSKALATVNGPFDDVPAHSRTTRMLDWEVELAVVIGWRGRDIPEPRALEHVFGYTVANDISARDLQRRPGVQWFKGKSLDGTCPLGPWIVTADEIPDPQTLQVSSSVNGEPRQSASTHQMVFSVAELIAVLSQGMTLEPGDVLLTGTPEGVGMGRQPPQFLGPDDVVECAVEGIGTIRNRISDD
jgi:2-keto-4-pentenoate hydratase/2-oxohepta-3-ene-1,7-dioic acid hydratase in catechol pathway